MSRIGGKAQDSYIRDQAGQMKLEYLQFLELEAFTRFGQRLEASMELRLKKGTLLREILKQERLVPQSILFQLAWLIAFNAGLFNEVKLSDISLLLRRIETGVSSSSLILASTSEQWLPTISEWLNIDSKVEDAV